MSWEHLVVPANKEMLKKKKNGGGYIKGTHVTTERAPNGQRWNSLRNKVILGYNPKYKISIDEFMLI